MTQVSPLRRRMIEDMTVRNLSSATQRSYISAVSKLSRYFGQPRQIGVGGRSSLPGASRLVRHFMAGAEPDRLCVAVLLRRDAWRSGYSRAHSVCAGAPQAARDIEP